MSQQPAAAAAVPAPSPVALPFEIVVPGVPASSQAKGRSKAAWKLTVTTAAQSSLPPGSIPTTDDVEIRIVYFHDAAPLDVDNMIKPIQDALRGVVYADDAQVADTHGSRRDLGGKFQLKGLSPALADGFLLGGPFVHIKVTEAPDPSELLT
jgi:crossover junction endodeoxyribonuclease RusA